MIDRSLWSRTAAAGTADRWIADRNATFRLDALPPAPTGLEGRCILLRSERQLPVALALLALDGVARRVLLCPPEIPTQAVADLLTEAEVDVALTDQPSSPAAGDSLFDRPTLDIAGQGGRPASHGQATEWILFTSGTMGRPKLVQHSLESLTGPLADGPVASNATVWSTFYDIRRYGGLQILLRALLGGGSLLLSHAGETSGDFFNRAAAAGVTHLLGTPTHWRRALMSPAVSQLALRYVRLSGEVADQAILNQLATAFPTAAISHAYASTEAGVGFEVKDGLEGFPPAVLGTHDGRDIRIVDGSLRIRSNRTAAGYLGHDSLADADGFVDTGDMVLERDGRCYFAGRRSGVINVGGQKVHPEEVEAVITRHPGVRMVQVRGRRSPITGMLVVADIVLRPDYAIGTIEPEVLAACRAVLPAHKVPAMIRVVPDLAVSASGKLGRADA